MRSAITRVLGNTFSTTLGELPPTTRARTTSFLARITHGSMQRRLLGRALRTLPAGATISIPGGPLRGSRWLAEPSLPLGMAVGDFEPEIQDVFVRSLKTGDVVLDVGAHVGFFTLLASQIVGASGHVLAFEPHPQAVAYLRRHIALNGLANVDVVDAAVSDVNGRLRFSGHEDLSMGHLRDAGEFEVTAVTLDCFVPGHSLGHVAFVKIDVEGAEPSVLLGAERLLRENRPRVVLSTHGQHVHERCCEILIGYGYEIELLSAVQNEAGFDYLGELWCTPGGRAPAGFRTHDVRVCTGGVHHPRFRDPP